MCLSWFRCLSYLENYLRKIFEGKGGGGDVHDFRIEI